MLYEPDPESSPDTAESSDVATYEARKLIDASTPVVVIGEHADEHETVRSALDIADALAAALLVDPAVCPEYSIEESAATHIGPATDNEVRAFGSDAMLVVGYEIEQTGWLMHRHYQGYATQIGPGSKEEWIEYRADLSPSSNRLCPCAIDLVKFGQPAEDASELAQAVTRRQSDSAEDSSVTVYGSPDDETPARPPSDEVEKGDSYRVATVRKCAVCHTETNKMVIGGYPSTGPRQYCPALRKSEEGWPPVGLIERQQKHDELAELLDRRGELEARLERYDADTAATDRTVQQIHDELETIDAKVRELREWFDGRFDDVEGVDSDKQKIPTFAP